MSRHLTVVGRDASMPSWAVISISCLSTLVLLAAGTAWLQESGWILSIFPDHIVSAIPAETPHPATFPSWVEVPHLTGPLRSENDPNAPLPADGPRTFLNPNPTEQQVFLPPRANPRQPLIGRTPLVAAQLTHEQTPVWSGRAERPDIVTSVPPSVVATLGPDVPQSSRDGVESGTTRARPADPTPTAVLPAKPAPVAPPTDVAVRPAKTVAVSNQPGRVATLGPDPAQPLVDRTSPITPPNISVVTVPILNPGPVRQARSLRRPKTGATAPRARVPYRDAEETASIISPPRSARTRIDAGAVAYASTHRARADRSAGPSTSPAPSSPWTLPPALAPTD